MPFTSSDRQGRGTAGKAVHRRPRGGHVLATAGAGTGGRGREWEWARALGRFGPDSAQAEAVSFFFFF